jgi:hypothetical protein
MVEERILWKRRKSYREPTQKDAPTKINPVIATVLL